MANLLDYLDWRGDLTLEQDPFNEVDNLILAELSFVDFQGIVPPPGGRKGVELHQAAEAFFARFPEGEKIDMGVLVPDAVPDLLDRMAASRRFGEMRLHGFSDRLDVGRGEQFAALTVETGDGALYLSFRGTLAGRLYAIGVPAALNLALPSLLVSALNIILAAFSQTYVVILGIYYKLQTFLYLPANGIVQGIRPLVGYNYGAGEHKRVARIYATSLALIAGIMAVGTVICWALPGALMGLFTDSADTISLGSAALRTISLGCLFSSVSVASTGALEGLSRGGPSLVITALRYVVVIIPAAFLLSRLWGAQGVWAAFPVTEVLTAVLSYLVYRRASRPAAEAAG